MRSRLYLFTASLLALSSAHAQAPQQNAPQENPHIWPQTISDMKADPDVRFGQLPNGLRYAILKNAKPDHSVSIRMRIGAGSLMEREGEQGLAHFLEHMAFRSTEYIADGETVHMLERQGLHFGADLNAFTSFDETVYMFDFPKADASALKTGLKLLQEISAHLKLNPDETEKERGVVLSEERLRDSPALRAYIAGLKFALPNMLAPERLPIGHIETIKAADSTKLRRFYAANYRPDNATIIVVGDVDVAAIEQMIKARFADWKAAGAPDPLDLGQVKPRGAASFLYHEAGAPESLGLTWQRPYDARADSFATQRKQYALMLGLAIFNRRLKEAAQMPDAPFNSAAAHAENHAYSGNDTGISLQAKPHKEKEAFAYLIEQQRQIVQAGVTDEEMSSLNLSFRMEYAAALAAKPTRWNPTLASDLASSVNSNNVFTSPEQDMALVEEFSKSISKQEVQAALAKAFSGAGPLFSRSTPDASATQAELETGMASALSAPVRAASAETKAQPWPYTSFGAAGRVVERKTLPDLGITLVRFANGTRLAVKHTDYAKDSISVAVSFGNGRLGMALPRAHAAWLVPGAFVEGGTKQRDKTQIDRATNSHLVSIAYDMGTTHSILAGTTRRKDFALQMQLLTAYASEPGFRPTGAERMKSALTAQLPLIETVPSAVFRRDAEPLLVHNDPRFPSLPHAQDIAASSIEDVQALVQEELATPKFITIVGDVDVPTAIAETAKSFGALPAGTPRPQPARSGIAQAPATPAPYVFTHKGRADQAQLMENWPLDDYFTNPKAARALNVAADIIRSKLTDTAREKLGITYSPRASSSSSLELKDYGNFTITNAMQPEKITIFMALTHDIIEELAAHGPSADDFTRAITPLKESRAKTYKTNGYWLSGLEGQFYDPRTLELVRHYRHAYDTLTRQDVQAAVRHYLQGKAPLVAEVVAQATEK
jgi:zinc protease